jgi:hypothetical protein
MADNFITPTGVIFSNVKVENVAIYPESKIEEELYYSLDLNLFLNTYNNRWTSEYIVFELKKTASILKKCGIKLTNIKLYTMNSVDIENSNTDSYGGISRIIGKPTVFFIPNGDHKFVGAAYTEKYHKDQLDLVNTAWIVEAAYIPDENNYSTIAHELFHLLTNQGHNQENVRNILSSSTDYLGSDVDPAQCDAAQRSPLVNKL